MWDSLHFQKKQSKVTLTANCLLLTLTDFQDHLCYLLSPYSPFSDCWSPSCDATVLTSGLNGAAHSLCTLLLCALNVEYTGVSKSQPSYGHGTFCLNFKWRRTSVKNSVSVQESLYSHTWQWNNATAVFVCLMSVCVCSLAKCTLRALNDLNVHKQSMWRQGIGCWLVSPPCITVLFFLLQTCNAYISIACPHGNTIQIL